ncbi:hypothetical protein [Streptomyces sp. NPDC088246]
MHGSASTREQAGPRDRLRPSRHGATDGDVSTGLGYLAHVGAPLH